MENFDFYKNKFEREQNRRTYLDGAINNPIIGVTVIVTLNSYILGKYVFQFNDWATILVITFLTITLIFGLIALILIFKSVNNLFSGYNYPSFGLMKDYRKFELDIIDYNEKCTDDSEKQTFKQRTVEKFIELADSHTIINDKRGLLLFKARSFIIEAVLLTFLNLSFVTIINFKMAEENKPTSVPAPSESPRPEPPRMPMDRIEKSESSPIPKQNR